MSIAELYRVTNPLSTPASGGVGGNSRPDSTLRKPEGPSEFQKVLSREQALNLSQHAETRIRSREIPWSEAIQKRVTSGIDALEAKGSREALILADGVAFIANVKSRTIVTAMEQKQMKDRIFTNIDSAVLV